MNHYLFKNDSILVLEANSVFSVRKIEYQKENENYGIREMEQE